MRIDDNFIIRQDSNNVILSYTKVGEINEKTGKNTVTNHEWYYMDLTSALKGYARHCLNLNKEVSDVVSQLNGIMDAIDKLAERYQLQ